jgi:hypothetical protein
MSGVFNLISVLSLLTKRVCEMLKLKALQYALVVDHLLMRKWKHLRPESESELQNGYSSFSIPSLYQSQFLLPFAIGVLSSPVL